MVVKFVCEYNGKNFCGFQRQAKGRSVQGVLEWALEKFFGQKIVIHGSGRTDAGVHARHQVCSFKVPANHKMLGVTPDRLHNMLFKLCGAVNAFIVKECLERGFDTPDLATCDFEEEDDDFHARFSVKRKTYVYRCYISDTVRPLMEPFYYRLNDFPDIDEMQEYADLNFVGRSVTIEEGGDDEIWFWVTGKGFTYKEVRKFVGQLLLDAKDKVVPAKGLTLWGIEY